MKQYEFRIVTGDTFFIRKREREREREKERKRNKDIQKGRKKEKESDTKNIEKYGSNYKFFSFSISVTSDKVN